MTCSTVSAFAHLYGNHDYNTQPFAPLGCTVKMHVALTVHETYPPHTVSGVSVGTLWKHYQYHKVWVKDTASVRIGYAVLFKYKHLTMPTLTTADTLMQAASDSTKTIDGGIPQTNKMLETLRRFMEIFKTNAENCTKSAAAQRVQNKYASHQRVQREEEIEDPKVEYDDNAPDDEEDSPARNTQARRHE